MRLLKFFENSGMDTTLWVDYILFPLTNVYLKVRVNGTHVWFSHLSLSFFVLTVSLIRSWTHHILLFAVFFLASINGKWKCQVRTWNKECFKKTARINLKNQADQAGNQQSKQKTGAMVSSYRKTLALPWVIDKTQYY